MDGPCRTVNPACVRSHGAQTSSGKRPVEFKPYYEIPRHTLPRMDSLKSQYKYQMLVEANSKPHDIVIYTDGSGTCLLGKSQSSRVEGLYTKTVMPTES